MPAQVVMHRSADCHTQVRALMIAFYRPNLSLTFQPSIRPVLGAEFSRGSAKRTGIQSCFLENGDWLSGRHGLRLHRFRPPSLPASNRLNEAAAYPIAGVPSGGVALLLRIKKVPRRTVTPTGAPIGSQRRNSLNASSSAAAAAPGRTSPARRKSVESRRTRITKRWRTMRF